MTGTARRASRFWLLFYYGIATRLPASYEPFGRLGQAARRASARRLLASCGEDVCIEPRVRLGDGSKVVLGSRSGIGRDSYVEGLEVEEDVMIGPELFALTRHHIFKTPGVPIRDQGATEPQSPSIGRGSWIGARVTLLPGVRVGRFCVVGAGAVVTKDLPDYSVAAGNPARVIRTWGASD